jgi:hypothetical protein
MNQADIRFRALSIALAFAVGATARVTVQTKHPEPLSIARQGYVFAGGKYSTVNDRQVTSGQLYAEFQIPSKQAGVHPKWIKLADVGIHGNGHMMMLEKNNLEIGAVMSKWLDNVLPNPARK